MQLSAPVPSWLPAETLYIWYVEKTCAPWSSNLNGLSIEPRAAAKVLLLAAGGRRGCTRTGTHIPSTEALVQTGRGPREDGSEEVVGTN